MNPDFIKIKISKVAYQTAYPPRNLIYVFYKKGLYLVQKFTKYHSIH